MKLSEEQFRQLLDRYLNNTALPEEREMLDRFFGSYQSGNAERELQNDPDLRREILHRINFRIAGEGAAQRERPVRLWLPLAAVIALFVLAYFFIKSDNVTNRTPNAVATVETYVPPGQKLVRVLPDGSMVHVNSDSKIEYAADFGATVREVTLTGEAYFEVVKDEKPFVVHAGTMRTEVLGTSFNIRYRLGASAEVTLVEGSVAVKTPARESLLRPNERAVIDMDSGDIATDAVSVMSFISWKDNVLFFEQTPLNDAITTLESWYAVKIDLDSPGLEHCLITGKYQDEPLGNVLSSFQFLLDLDIKRLDETHFSITGTACK